MATRVRLRRLFQGKRSAAPVLGEMMDAAGTPMAVYDAGGALLVGAADMGEGKPPDRHPVRCEGETIGWVVGEQQAAVVASWLSYLAAREAEKDGLCDEVLNLYRELNLLYNLSERLATSLQLDVVAESALGEASRLIEGSGGAILLRDEQTGAHRVVAAFGRGIQADLQDEYGILGCIAPGARAEIINDLGLDSRGAEGGDPVHALICAPLQSKGAAIGMVVLVSEAPVTYTAADLSLLKTVASQAAPALENALLYERALREAREREAQLEKQLEDLRIELDEAKQQQQVSEITETEYFQRLRQQADHLRRIVRSEEP